MVVKRYKPQASRYKTQGSSYKTQASSYKMQRCKKATSFKLQDGRKLQATRRNLQAARRKFQSGCKPQGHAARFKRVSKSLRLAACSPYQFQHSFFVHPTKA